MQESFDERDEHLTPEGRVESPAPRGRGEYESHVSGRRLEYEANETIDYADLLLEAWNKFVDADEARALERYGGKTKWLAGMRKWMNQEITRARATSLEDVGEAKKTSLGKWVKIGTKVLGGGAVATGLIMSGGFGAGLLANVLNPTALSMATKEVYDGLIELGQYGINKKSRDAEFARHQELGQVFRDAAAEIQAGTMTEQRFNELMDNAKKAEDVVMATQAGRLKSENKQKLFRAIGSTALTIPTTLIAGIPFGGMDVDKGATVIDGQTVLTQEVHRTALRWDLGTNTGEATGGIGRGLNFEFLYNSAKEVAKAHADLDILNHTKAMIKQGLELSFTEGKSLVGYAVHEMTARGLGLNWEAIAGLATASATTIARAIEEALPNKMKLRNRELSVNRNEAGDSGNAEYIKRGASPEKRARLRAARSETLRSNPEAILKLSQESARYLDGQDSAYRAELTRMVDHLGPMSDTTELVINIPAAADQEAGRILETLEHYLKQVDRNGEPIDRSRFEIIIFANYTEKSDKERVGEFLEKISQFKAQHPDFPIRVFSQEFKSTELTIGKVRKMMSDAALARGRAAGREKDFIMVSNDADAVAISSQYINGFLEEFSAPENKLLGGVMGKLDWDPYILETNPIFTAGTRAMQYLDTLAEHRGNSGDKRNIASSGANFAYRASMYAAVGGYDAESRGGEDNALGDAIYFAREKGDTEVVPTMKKGKKNTALYTSARRAVQAFVNAFSPAEMWSKPETKFKVNDAVRNSTDAELAELIRSEDDFIEGLRQNDPQIIEKFDRDLEKILNQTFELYGIDDPMWLEKVMQALNIKGTTEKGRIHLTDTSGYRRDFLSATSDGRYAAELLSRNFAGDKDFEVTIPQTSNPETATAELKAIDLVNMQPGDEIFTADSNSRVIMTLADGSRVEVGTVSKQADGSFFVLGLDGNSVKDSEGNMIDSVPRDQLTVYPRNRGGRTAATIEFTQVESNSETLETFSDEDRRNLETIKNRASTYLNRIGNRRLAELVSGAITTELETKAGWDPTQRAANQDAVNRALRLYLQERGQ